MTVMVTIPGLRTVSESNMREHWSVKAKRVRLQREFVAVALASIDDAATKQLRASPRVVVQFTRVGGKKLDSDNLVGAFKACRDQVAKWLGKDDAPGSGIVWEPPLQIPGDSVAVWITLAGAEGRGSVADLKARKR